MKWVKSFAVTSTVVTGILFLYNGYTDSKMPNIIRYSFHTNIHGEISVTNKDEPFFAYFVLTKLVIGVTLISTALYVGYNWDQSTTPNNKNKDIQPSEKP